MVVVRAELYAVQRTMENMRMKPKTQERKKHNKNHVSDQPSNSAASLITNISYKEFPQSPNMSKTSSVMRKTAVAGSNMKRQL